MDRASGLSKRLPNQIQPYQEWSWPSIAQNKVDDKFQNKIIIVLPFVTVNGDRYRGILQNVFNGN